MKLWTVATVFVFLAIPTIASAHYGNDDPNVVHACVGNVSQVVRIVGVSGSCVPAPASKAETPAHWALQGPQGAPGTNGTNGTNGIDGTSVALPDPPCFDNTNRYVKCGNGTVTDTVTGLIWLQQANCLADANYSAANQAAAGLKAGDCSLTDGSSAGDWRLPTKDEWSATIFTAFGCIGNAAPSLANDVGTDCLWVGPSSFAGVGTGAASGSYWSSASFWANPTHAWVANLTFGGVGNNDKDGTLRVWPVRGGPR